jgi:hypothetical protein
MTRNPGQLAALILLSCASCTGGPGLDRGDKEGTATPLKTPESEIPAAVRAIETRIDTPSALIADEVEIHCSRNYEWDVSLVGDVVSPQRPDGTEHVSVAEGSPRATFRNLEIRAHRRITFRKSGFGVAPFIRIVARGHAAYATSPGTSAGSVRRGELIRILNADIQIEGEVQPAGTR